MVKKLRENCRKCSISNKEIFICKNGYCSTCNAVLSRKYYLKHRDTYIRNAKKYYKNNTEKVKEYSKEWAKENPDSRKKTYIKNKDKILKHQNEYRKKNKDKINSYFRKRRKEDIQFKISGNMRSRISDAVKGDQGTKSPKLVSLLGCSIQELKIHLESKFLPTMTWENYGSLWHIDHKIPCILFDLAKHEEQLKCFNYMNLQPLFAIDTIIDGVFYEGNINKGDKVEIMIKNISVEKLVQLIKKGFSYDYIYILLCIKQGLPLDSFKESVKINSIIETMVRKGLITEEGKITIEGQNLIDFSESDNNKETIKKVKIEDEIALFWKVFPSTDQFEYKGKKFTGSRALKTNKEECKLKLKSIINEGELTIEQIVAAVQMDIYMKKENSVKTGQNKLTFLQNSLTYLRQKSYEPFIELIENGHKVKTEEQAQNEHYDGVNI